MIYTLASTPVAIQILHSWISKACRLRYNECSPCSYSFLWPRIHLPPTHRYNFRRLHGIGRHQKLVHYHKGTKSTFNDYWTDWSTTGSAVPIPSMGIRLMAYSDGNRMCWLCCLCIYAALKKDRLKNILLFRHQLPMHSGSRAFCSRDDT